MKTKKMICIIVLVIVALTMNGYIIRSEKYLEYPVVDFYIEAEADTSIEMQIYYDYGNQEAWIENQSVKGTVSQKAEYNQYKINSVCSRLRMDFGVEPAKIVISDMYIQYKENKVQLPLEYFVENKGTNQIKQMEVVDGKLILETEGTDPYSIIDISELGIKDKFQPAYLKSEHSKNIILCAIIDIITISMVLLLDIIILFANDLLKNQRLIMSLAKNDFRTRYAGSYLGIIWAFIQPIVTILVYWFVFQVGFQSGPVNGCPYILWFMAGLIPWFFFSEALSTATNSLIEYNYLVKKVVFKISILPVVKVLSALFVHVFFVGILVILFIGSGYHHIFMLQVIYYSFCMMVLALGISYTTAACVVFFRDLGQIISIILQVGMWLTPIMWNYAIVPVQYQWILKINPMFYVVEGYRNSLISGRFFLANIGEGVYFWVITALLFIIGIKAFQRLKVHFADIL